MKLSVCLITKDEEHNIGDCLESVREIVDEIVLVDTGSGDATVEIATGNGAAVFNVPWRDNFAAAKNETLKHATGDWILALDADERLSAVNRQKIRKLLENPSYQAYLLQLRCPYTLKGSLQGVNTGLAIRLFRNNIGLRYYGRIHERIIPCIGQKEITVANTNIVIEHLGYQQDLEPKYRRNLSVAQKRKTGHDAFSRYDLARMYAGLGRYAEAEKQLKRGLEFIGIISWLRAQMHVLLGDILVSMNREESEAVANWRQAVEIEPNIVAPRLRLGRYCYRRRDFEAATEQFRNIVDLLSLGGLRGAAIDDECTLAEAYAALAACCAVSGRREEAADALVKSRMPMVEDETLKVVPWDSGFR